MHTIIARTYTGARDLFHGIPNLKNAKVIDIIPDNSKKDYRTTLVLEDVKGNQHKIIIALAE